MTEALANILVAVLWETLNQRTGLSGTWFLTPRICETRNDVLSTKLWSNCYVTITNTFKLRRLGSARHVLVSMHYRSLGFAIDFLSFSHRGYRLWPRLARACFLLFPRGLTSAELLAHNTHHNQSFSYTKERFLVFLFVLQGHYWSFLLDYDSEIPIFVTTSFISLCFCSLSPFKLVFFCSSLLLDLILLFIATFSCKLFSPASAFTYRKRHYLPSGNVTFVWKEQLSGNIISKKNTGEGWCKRALFFSEFLVFVPTHVPYQNIPCGS